MKSATKPRSRTHKYRNGHKLVWKQIKPLTDRDIHQIRMLRGKESAQATGLRFDRSQASISAIQRYMTYHHVPLTPEERKLASTTLSTVVGRFEHLPKLRDSH